MAGVKDLAGKDILLSLLSVTLLLLLWELVAALVGAPVILPAPGVVLLRLWSILAGESFMAHFLSTLWRVLISFLISLLGGIVLGIGSGLSNVFRRLLSPLILSMRTIPVMAIILIAILWFPSDIVPVFAALLMALPVVTGALERSIREIDKKLLEMAWIFHFSRSDRFWKVIVPQILPAILTSAHLTLGLCWKVVIAGEILTIPGRGIGSEMQLAQLSIESETVFAWTLVVVISAALSQLFLSLGERLRRWKPL